MSLERFKAEYEGRPAWDIGEPQKYFVELFSKQAPTSPVLDVGCGTGDMAIFAAELDCDVLGVDIVPKAIDIANSKIPSGSPQLSFKVHDAFELASLGKKFNSVIDCCFFHMLDDEARRDYSTMLYQVLEPGGRLYALNFAVKLPTPNSPRAVTTEAIETTFTQGWSIEYIGAAKVGVTFPPFELPGTAAILVRDA